MGVGGGKNAGPEQCELFWIRTSAVQFENEPEFYALVVCIMLGKKHETKQKAPLCSPAFKNVFSIVISGRLRAHLSPAFCGL